MTDPKHTQTNEALNKAETSTETSETSAGQQASTTSLPVSQESPSTSEAETDAETKNVSAEADTTAPHAPSDAHNTSEEVTADQALVPSSAGVPAIVEHPQVQETALTSATSQSLPLPYDASQQGAAEDPTQTPPPPPFPSRPWWKEKLLHGRTVLGLGLLLLVLVGLWAAPLQLRLPSWFPRSPMTIIQKPTLELRFHDIQILWQGHNAKEIRRVLTRPWLEALLTHPLFTRVQSQSEAGRAWFRVHHRPQTTADQARTALQQLVANLNPSLPQDARTRVRAQTSTYYHLASFTLEGRDEQGKAVSAWTAIERSAYQAQLHKAFLQLPGIARVDKLGGMQPLLRIILRPMQLRRYKLSISDVVRAIERSRINASTFDLDIGTQKLQLALRSLPQHLQALTHLLIPRPDAPPLQLRQIATIRRDARPVGGLLFKDGVAAIGLRLYLTPGASRHLLYQRVQQRFRDMQRAWPTKVLSGKGRARLALVALHQQDHAQQPRRLTLNRMLPVMMLLLLLVLLVLLLQLRRALLLATLPPLTILGGFALLQLSGQHFTPLGLIGLLLTALLSLEWGAAYLLEAESSERAETQKRPSEQAMWSTLFLLLCALLPFALFSGTLQAWLRPAWWTTLSALALVIVLVRVCFPLLASIALGQVELFRDDPHGMMQETTALLGQVLLILAGLWLMESIHLWVGLLVVVLGLYQFSTRFLPESFVERSQWLSYIIVVTVACLLLTLMWEPLGRDQGIVRNLLFVLGSAGNLLLLFQLLRRLHAKSLQFLLRYRWLFVPVPLLLLVLGLWSGLGFQQTSGWMPKVWGIFGSADTLEKSTIWQGLQRSFPGLPASILPVHRSHTLQWEAQYPQALTAREAKRNLQRLGHLLRSVPEVQRVWGQWMPNTPGIAPSSRAKLRLWIKLKTRMHHVTRGKRTVQQRQWRPHIRRQTQIVEELRALLQWPGFRSTPLYDTFTTRWQAHHNSHTQPQWLAITARTTKALKDARHTMLRWLHRQQVVDPSTTFPDRAQTQEQHQFVVKPSALARYHVQAATLEATLNLALRGRSLSPVLTGTQTIACVLQLPQGQRHDLDAILQLPIPRIDGGNVPLRQLVTHKTTTLVSSYSTQQAAHSARIWWAPAPQQTLSSALTTLRHELQQALQQKRLSLPAHTAVHFRGLHEQQRRETRSFLRWLALATFLMFLLLWWRLRSIALILVLCLNTGLSMLGGLLALSLYQNPYFLNINILGIDLQNIFHVRPIAWHPSLWLGFAFLLGLTLHQGLHLLYRWKSQDFDVTLSPEALREECFQRTLPWLQQNLVIVAAIVLLLLPLLTTTGPDDLLMSAVALPCFGGMMAHLLNLLCLPLLLGWYTERQLRLQQQQTRTSVREEQKAKGKEKAEG